MFGPTKKKERVYVLTEWYRHFYLISLVRVLYWQCITVYFILFIAYNYYLSSVNLQTLKIKIKHFFNRFEVTTYLFLLQSFEDPHDLTVSPKATWPAHSSRRKLISGLCFLRMARCSRLRPHLSLTFAYRLQLSSFFRSSRDPSSTAWNTLFTYAWAGRKGHVIYLFFWQEKTVIT